MCKKINMLLLIFFLSFSQFVSAHPGNTDSSGGHTCYTNCEEYGLSYGEYHYHDTSNTVDYYSDGYNRGYEYAYSYTSMCEEEYEWWWEGPQDFGDGYEQGIKDGHNDGLEVCIEDSYSAGYDDGYQDHQSGYDYQDETYDYYNIDSYAEGYREGFKKAKAEKEKMAKDSIIANKNDSRESNLDVNTNTQSVEKNVYIYKNNKIEPYELGYEKGFSTALNNKNYLDFIGGLTEADLEKFKTGYYAGYIEGGGGSTFDRYYYWLALKYKWYSLSAIVVLLSVVLFLLLRRSRSKNKGEGKKPFPWQKSSFVFSILVVLTFIILTNLKSDKFEPVDSDIEQNPYTFTTVDHDCVDFDTQKDAQLFYEANGGPSSDPHDLDRDNDGMACDWNP